MAWYYLSVWAPLRSILHNQASVRQPNAPSLCQLCCELIIPSGRIPLNVSAFTTPAHSAGAPKGKANKRRCVNAMLYDGHRRWLETAGHSCYPPPHEHRRTLRTSPDRRGCSSHAGAVRRQFSENFLGDIEWQPERLMRGCPLGFSHCTATRASVSVCSTRARITPPSGNFRSKTCSVMLIPPSLFCRSVHDLTVCETHLGRLENVHDRLDHADKPNPLILL